MPSRTAAPAPELSAAQRKALRALAHHLDPVVTIGDSGLSAAVLAETERALAAHGLVKIRVHGDDRERRAEMMGEICERLGCAPVQSIGKLLVVWREKRETGTGGDAGTARRKPERQTKKAIGAGKEETSAGSRPARNGTAGRALTGRPITRSARPGSGTRAGRRGP